MQDYFLGIGNEIGEDPNDANMWRYSGEYWDKETKTQYLRNRYYNPVSGRFTSEDTYWNIGNMLYGSPSTHPKPNIGAIRQSGNLYVYVTNNPIMFFDPTGLNSKMRQLSPEERAMVKEQQQKAWNEYGPGALSLGLSSTPVVGDVKDAQEAIIGVDLITGERLTTGDRIMSGVSVVMPVVSGKLLRGAGKLLGDVITSKNIRFSQDSISPSFSNGSLVDDMVTGLKGGTIKPNDVPAIRILEKDGAIFTLDNRRLYAFQEAKVDNIPYRWATPEEIANESWKFTTTNGGTSAKVRRQ